MVDLLLYAIAWLSFGAVHSLLARQSVQKKLEPYMQGTYRLLYNGFALLHILAVLLLGRLLMETQQFHFLSNYGLSTVLLAVKYFGVFVILLALTKYDLGRFSGLTQVRTLEYLSEGSDEPLQRGGLNSYVRHPLYTGAFLYLWGGAHSSYGLATAILGSIYLVIGTLLEEQKLISYYGDAYNTYQKEVPRYFPFKRNTLKQS